MGLKCTLPPQPRIAFLGDSITKGNTSFFDGGHGRPNLPVVVALGCWPRTGDGARRARRQPGRRGARPCPRTQRSTAGPSHGARADHLLYRDEKITPAATLDAVLIMLGTNDARVPTADVDAHLVDASTAIVRAVVARPQLEPLHPTRSWPPAIWALRRRRRGAGGARAAARLTRIGVIRRPRAARARLALQMLDGSSPAGDGVHPTALSSGSPTRCAAKAAAAGGGGSPSAAGASSTS